MATVSGPDLLKGERRLTAFPLVPVRADTTPPGIRSSVHHRADPRNTLWPIPPSGVRMRRQEAPSQVVLHNIMNFPKEVGL